MLKRQFVALVLTTLMSGLGACADTSGPTQMIGAGDLSVHRNSLAGQGNEDPGRPDEAELRKFSGLIGGFGGSFYDDAGNVHVFLRNPRDQHAASAAHNVLKPLLAEWQPGRGRARPTSSKVILQEGQFTFDELRAWRDRLSDPVLNVGGAWFIDLDESTNRITIGLDPMHAGSARGQVEALLARAEVPGAAITFELRNPSTPVPVMCTPEDLTCGDPCAADPSDPLCNPDPCSVDLSDPSCSPDPCSINPSDPACNPDPCSVNPSDPACSSDPCVTDPGGPSCPPQFSLQPGNYYGGSGSLRERVRPVFGGTEFWAEYRNRYNSIVPSICTLGFPVRLDNVPGWITAAHCTGRMGVVETVPFYQGSYYLGKTGTLVGYESKDPRFNTAGNQYMRTSLGYCTYDYLCRRSDFAFVPASNLSEWQLKYIAAPNYGASGYGQAGPFTLYNSVPPLMITGEQGSPRFNSVAGKVGRSTGWTYGKITKTCSDQRYTPKGGEPNPTNIILRCQTYVDGAYADAGDSGAPAFIYNPNNQVTLLGVVWGKDPDGRGLWFSSVDLIRLDLGIAVGDRTRFKTY